MTDADLPEEIDLKDAAPRREEKERRPERGERRKAADKERKAADEERKAADEEENTLTRAWRWARYTGIGLGAFIIGNYTGSCAGVPTELTFVDADQDGAKDVLVTDRGYLGLFGKDNYNLLQNNGRFERASESELVERIKENARRER